MYIYFRTVALILLPMLLVYITFHDLRHFFDQEYSFPLGLPSILLSCPEFQLRLPPAAFLQAVSRQLRQCVDDRPSKPPTLPSSLPVPSDARAYDAHQCQQEIKLRHIDVGAAAMLEERWPPRFVVT